MEDEYNKALLNETSSSLKRLLKVSKRHDDVYFELVGFIKVLNNTLMGITNKDKKEGKNEKN